MELLVTIIIAGIAFAALVPVFVGAQQAASGDLMRNAALQLAQDKLEKVRGLDYDVIEPTALTNNTIPNGQFGTSTTWATGGGGSRTFSVSYQVDYIAKSGNAGATPGAESYKQVTITVAWTAPPKPVRPVVLSTMVSKQYAGPQIVSVDLGPPNALDFDTTTGVTTIVGGPLDIDVFIAPEDILSMNQGAVEAESRLRALHGHAAQRPGRREPEGIAAGELRGACSLPLLVGQPRRGSPLTNGVYIIEAVAVAGFGSRSQGMPWSIALTFTNNTPPPPTSLAALPGD